MIDQETLDTPETNCFFREVIIMLKINHPSVLKLIGLSPVKVKSWNLQQMDL